MESSTAWLHPFWAFALPIAASFPLGWSMSRSLDPPDDRAGRGLDALPMFLCRLLGRREPAEMDWKRYAVALLAFNAALFVITFGLLYAQQHLPLNPDGKGSLGALGLQGRRRRRPPRRRHRRSSSTRSARSSPTRTCSTTRASSTCRTSASSACIVWLMFVTPAAGLA